jgi:hypothetical protein
VDNFLIGHFGKGHASLFKHDDASEHYCLVSRSISVYVISIGISSFVYIDTHSFVVGYFTSGDGASSPGP